MYLAFVVLLTSAASNAFPWLGTVVGFLGFGSVAVIGALFALAYSTSPRTSLHGHERGNSRHRRSCRG